MEAENQGDENRRFLSLYNSHVSSRHLGSLVLIFFTPFFALKPQTLIVIQVQVKILKRQMVQSSKANPTF